MWSSIRQVPPRRLTYKIAAMYSPTPCRGHGRPLLGWGWISRWEALPCGVGQMRGSAGAAALLRNSNVRSRLSRPPGTILGAMRHTTFRFALAPTPAQVVMLARHAGASRFAYNQCLQLITDALATKRTDPQVRVPWSGFDLINAYNGWKRSEAAGRIYVVTPDGTITKQVTGLAWRHAVSAQVFEEAAVDLGRALSAYSHAKAGTRKGRRVGFPRRKRKRRCRDGFRLRNKQGKGDTFSIRVGEGHPRSVTLPRIGVVRVHDDTRRLRRLLRPVERLDPDTRQLVVAPRAKVLFATVSRHGSRWYVSLNVQAPDFHAQRRHPPRPAHDSGGFVGVDRGLAAFAVAATADGTEVGRFKAPTPLRRDMVGLRRRSRRASSTRPRSRNRAKAIRRLSRQHARIANIRRHFLHAVSSMRSPDSSSRPTTGCVWKTSPSPTS